jgi:hypothetical protein
MFEDKKANYTVAVTASYKQLTQYAVIKPVCRRNINAAYL